MPLSRIRGRRSRAIHAAAALTALGTANAVGQTVREWANPISDNFAVATRWNPLGKPVGTDEANFNEAGTYTIGFTVNESFGPLEVSAGNVSWASASARTVNATSVTVSNTNTSFRLLDTVFLTCSGVTTVNTASGDMTVTGGRLTTNALQVSQGTLALSSASSLLNVNGATNVGGQGLVGSLVLSNGAVASFGNTLNLAPGGNGAFATGIVVVTSGAQVTLDGNLNAGTTSDEDRQGRFTVSGTNSQVTQTSTFGVTLGRLLTTLPVGDESSRIEVGGGGAFTSGGGAITLQNLGHINVNAAGTFNANGAMTIQAGGALNVTGGTHNANVATTVQPGGALNVTGGGTFNANSTLTVQGALNAPTGRVNVNSNEDLVVAAGGHVVTGSMRVANGATVTATAGTFDVVGGSDGLLLQNGSLAHFGNLALGNGGQVTVNNGAELRLASLTAQGGAVRFFGGLVNFTQATTLDGARIDALLGADATLRGGRTLRVQGLTTLESSLVLDGGTFTVNALTGGSLLDLRRGTLNFTSTGLTVGGSGQFGSSLTIGPDVAINVQGGSASVNSEGTLLMTGGQLTTTTGLLNSGLVALDAPTARIAGGLVTNIGVLRGDGVIAANFSNGAGGEVRVDTGDALRFLGVNSPNAGRFNLLGGTADLAQPLTNGANGQIIGRGNLMVGGTGLNNLGQVIFSNGSTSVFGDVNNNTANAAKGITITGNGDVTFWDDVTHAGASLFKVQAGSSATFFGSFGGAGAITGGGDVYFEADLTPGASPAVVSYDANVHFGPEAVSVIELGGPTPGSQFDQVNVGGSASLAGQIDLELFAAYDPAYLVRHTVFTADVIDGRFGTVGGVVVSPTKRLAVTYDASNVFVTAALPGDANLDGRVNLSDFNALAGNFGLTGRSWATGDFSGDGLVNLNDFNALAGTFGLTVGPAGLGVQDWAALAANVPEPAALLASLVVSIIAPFRPSRRRRRRA